MSFFNDALTADVVKNKISLVCINLAFFLKYLSREVSIITNNRLVTQLAVIIFSKGRR